ncbi:MAG: hypothetical protein RR736_23950 [Pseudomonas sp.]|uniref:hypothetical protein n=1 Tax=Pseudomonas sp. TaxID=306 RepID=UPI002FC66AA8
MSSISVQLDQTIVGLTPEVLAKAFWAMDCTEQADFSPEQFSGEQREEYEDEAAHIERQWDNQPN